MQLELLKSKIHRATVTDANLNYEGSITIARDLMDAAHILPFEKVGVLDVNNGSRLDTYVIEGPSCPVHAISAMHQIRSIMFYHITKALDKAILENFIHKSRRDSKEHYILR